MNLKARISALHYLGEYINSHPEFLQAVLKRTEFNNAWFTLEFQNQALQRIATHFLSAPKLYSWVAEYPNMIDQPPHNVVGIILAGNIPSVGFHDIICTFVAGHFGHIKLSEKDPYVLPHLIDVLTYKFPNAKPYFQFVEKLTNYDAVIATGSNNTARHFNHYFGKNPHIIRKNRNAIAILNGNETQDEIRQLGYDIFDYFGLGCRNVSKLYLPANYDFGVLMETLHEFKHLINHSKYKNNFDYNLALLQLNKVPISNNGALIVFENHSLQSRIATLHFEYYKDNKDILKHINPIQDQIQLILSQNKISGLQTQKFGTAQEPKLRDYADGIDTLQWLNDLHNTKQIIF